MEPEPAPEPWEEALDIDDSDLPSFLRPCKRPHHSPPHPIPQQPSSHSQYTVPSLHSLPTPSISSSPTLIPGPAGTLQSAMLRKSSNDQDLRSRGEQPVPTQEYLRKALEEGDENDADFARSPWLCALEVLRRMGMVGGNGVLFTTPLNSIRSCSGMEKMDMVVAIVQSCAPNGLGDLIVTLKDPTGTVGASIHHKIISEEEIGNDISVGAVLILQKVAAFYPSRSASYLNITRNNVVKVISKDGALPINQNITLPSVKDTDPCMETSEDSWMQWKSLPPPQRGTDGIISKLIDTNNVRECTVSEKQLEKLNSPMIQKNPSSKSNEVNRTEPAIEIVKDDRVLMARQPILSDGTERENPSSSRGCKGAAEDCVEAPNNREVEDTNHVDKQETPVSITSLPRWTDEQLEELFAFD